MTKGRTPADSTTRAIRAWGVRANPHHVNRIDEFLDGELVALGWPDVPSLARLPEEQIRVRVQRAYRLTNERDLGRNVGPLDTFVNRIGAGDLVVVPAPRYGGVFIGQFRGGYRYVASKKKLGYPHQRAVQWLFSRAVIPREELPPEVVRPLRAQQPIFSIDSTALIEFVKSRSVRLFDADTDADFSALEGHRSVVLRSQARRVQALRKRKIAHALAANGGRLLCEVPGCGFDFEAKYGDIGKHFAHVHHVRPLASIAGERTVPISELAIVCANCHAMIHRHGACRGLDELIPR